MHRSAPLSLFSSRGLPAVFSLLLLLPLFLLSSAPKLLAVDEPAEIRQLASMLKPGKHTGDKLRNQYLQIVARLHATWLDTSVRPSDQVDRAMRLNNAVPTRVMVTRAGVLDAYESARAMGLFTPEGWESLNQFRATKGDSQLTKILSGPQVGKEVTLHPYLKGDAAKDFRSELGNWRLGAVDEVLSPDAQEALDRIAGNRLQMLKQMRDQELARIEEQRALANSKANEKEAFEEKWEQALTDADGRKPEANSVRIRGQGMEMPNRDNKETVRLEGRVDNSSALPLKAKLEYYFIGRTPKRRAFVNLGSKSSDLRVLPGSWHDFEARSMGVNSGKAKDRVAAIDRTDRKKTPAPRYLGWVIRVVEEESGKVLAYHTSGLAELNELAANPNGMDKLKEQQ